MRVIVEFSGGLELLFDKKTKLDITVDQSAGAPSSSVDFKLRDLIRLLREQYLRERPELFIQNDSVRPGILVLINDTDWELLGGIEYALQERDNIVFISTLHGG